MNSLFNYFVAYLRTDLRNNSLSVVRQRREVRTWAAAEKSLRCCWAV